MKKIKAQRRLLRGSLVCFGLMSASFTLMAPWPGTGGYGPLDVAAGVLFWASALAGCLLQILFCRSCGKRKGRPGIFRFCRIPWGLAADIGCVAGLTGFAVSMHLTDRSGIICYFFLGFSVFSLIAHCIFNGKCYNYIQQIIALNGEENKSPVKRTAGRRRK